MTLIDVLLHRDGDVYSFRIGATRLKKPKQAVDRTLWAVRHENFDWLTYANDIGLIRTEKELVDSTQFVPLVSLDNSSVTSDSIIKLTGYGKNKHAAIWNWWSLNSVWQTVLTSQDCQRRFDVTLYEGQFCTYSSGSAYCVVSIQGGLPIH